VTGMQWVVDTNVLVSRLLMPKGVAGQAFDVAVHSGALLMSPATLAELSEVVMRPKFDRFVDATVRRGFLSRLGALVQVVHPTQTVTACRDPKDNKFLEVALHGNATAILTGDADLLVLHPFQDIPVLSPPEFHARFSSAVGR
jgi:uncharacterized protein